MIPIFDLLEGNIVDLLLLGYFLCLLPLLVLSLHLGSDTNVGQR